MMQDYKNRQTTENVGSEPKRLNGILYDRYWIDPCKPAVLFEHQTMKADTLDHGDPEKLSELLMT